SGPRRARRPRRPRRARRLGTADAAGAWRLGGYLPGLAAGLGRGVRRPARDGAVAGGTTAHVRPGGGGSATAVLLRRGRAAAAPGADRRAAGTGRALRAGARRAVRYGGAVPVPGRAGQCG